ncbi:hypothetical protein Tco_1556686 [Tanacetum coccineum]
MSMKGIFGITHVPRQKYWPVMPVEHIASCFWGKLQVHHQVTFAYCCSLYIAALCDDETCDYTTRSLNLRAIRDSQRGTFILTSILRQMCTSSSLFSDSNRCMDKVEANFRNSVEKEVARITPQKIKAKKPTWKLGSSFSLKKPVKILLKVLIDDDIDLIHRGHPRNVKLRD